MRVLVLCDRYPDSYQDGLLLRVLHLARWIGARHDLDLIAYHDGERSPEHEEFFRRVWTVPRPRAKAAPGWLAPFTGWAVRDFYPPSVELCDLLECELRADEYDLVWDAGASIFQQLPSGWDHVPVVADLVDDMVLTSRRALLATKGFSARLRQLKYLSHYYRFERYVMRRAAVCVVVSEEDAESFRRVSPTVPVSVVQNGVDLDYFAPSDRPQIPGRLVFEGSMAFGPNQLAAIHLVTEVMPLVWAQRPDATVTLVGRDPSAEILALRSDRVQVTGSVPDVRPYVQEAEVFVCPLLSGAGIKNKLLQAWAMGKAVVATTVSVGGLKVLQGRNVIVANAAREMADAVLDLLANPLKRQLLGDEGRQTVAAEYSWAGRAASFEGLLMQAANAGQAGGRLTGKV